jgi:ATP-dependent DNA ligase
MSGATGEYCSASAWPENGKAGLRLFGKVGIGFTNEVSKRLRRQLEKKIGDKPRLTGKLRRPDTKWVQPDLKAKIA